MRKLFCGLMLVISMGLSAGNKPQPLNVKVGLGEVKQSVTTSGEMPIPPDTLAKMTPEQRARLEARMKANAGGKTTTTTHKSCLTKEQLEKDPTFSENPNCSWTVLTSNGSKVEARGVCVDNGMKSRVNLQVESLNTESVKGTGQAVVSGGDHTMNVNLAFTSKWLGPTCGRTP
jgi:hypothetical protein